ncbi:MAG: phosphatidate cytidylyltransferase [Alphaproteobacteria bacterium]
MFDALTPNVQIALAGIVALLVAASAGVFVFNRLRPDNSCADLTPRLRSWWLMVATFSATLALGRSASLVLLALISFLALKEYLSLIPTRRIDRPLMLWAYAAIPLQYYWVASGRYDMFVAFVPLYGLLVLSARAAFAGQPHGFLRIAGSLNWGLLITVFALAHLGFLVVLPAAGNPAGGSAGLLMYLVFLAQFSDVVQYIAGKSLGRRRIAPRISPNKTWEGLIVGLVTTVVLAAALAPWITPLDRGEGLIAGLLIGLAGFAGDITVSAVKRDLGVKDTSSLLPGHGGLLDRVDSLILAAPIFYHFLQQIHYGGVS